MAGIKEFFPYTHDPEEKMSDALALRFFLEGHSYDFTPTSPIKFTPRAPRPADQQAAEALRVSQFHLRDQREPITVEYWDGDVKCQAACYSEESAAAMVRAFCGRIV